MTELTKCLPQVKTSLALNKSDYGRYVLRFLNFWADMNSQFFDEVFPLEDMPIVMFRPLLKERCEGIFTQSHHNKYGYPLIELCEQILTGTHPLVMAEKEFEEGRLRYLEDIFLHEMVHHFVDDFSWKLNGIWNELLKRDTQKMMEISKAGIGLCLGFAKKHGYAFCHKANQISEVLKISKVRVATAEEILDAEELECFVESFDESPLCDYFPHNVRPENYYLKSIKGRS